MARFPRITGRSTVKEALIPLLQQGVNTLKQAGVLPEDLQTPIRLDHSKNPAHGDLATNLALMLAKPAGMNPRELAERLLQALPENDLIAKTEVAGPGFINFFLQADAGFSLLHDITAQGSGFGATRVPEACRVTVEFVSANPTGPLHVGHGRGAAYGASLANVLRATGYEVQTEYYVNDAGRQMHILATSVWLRYLEACGEPVRFPDNGYRGDYIHDIARAIHATDGERWHQPWDAVAQGLPPDEQQGGDKEKHVDALIERAQSLLGEAGYARFFDAALQDILAGIRKDLEDFGVVYDEWFSERSLVDSGAIDRALEALKAADAVYEKNGALWFAASRYGDEKDRVVVRDNGQTTYFASDIAYFLNKLERGFEKALYVFGADHHGYVPRLRAVARGLGKDPDVLEIPLVQFAVLWRGGKKVQMSTRSGQFVTLRELMEEVGSDAARFFYVMRSHEQHLDFDLDLATSRSNENPVYTIQYAHARVCSLFRQAGERGLSRPADWASVDTGVLQADAERELVKFLGRYSEQLIQASRKRAPHVLAHYLRELAHHFHSWYNGHPVLVDETELRHGRMLLAEACRQVIANGLSLLGVTAPEKM